MRSLITLQSLLLLMPIFLSVAAMVDNSTASMEKSELEALYSVIQSFVGKWWNGKELYPDPCGWTAIQGVSCDFFDGQWYITSLNFGPLLENSLECSHDAMFSPDLFQLKHLKTISFYQCFSSPLHHPMTIPSQNWEKLSGSLDTLEFRSNTGLTGELPAGLGRLASLRCLIVVDNGLKGTIPPQLGNLVHLQRLMLAGNNFSSQVPVSLGQNLQELLILDLSRNSLTGPLPPTLGGFSSLLKLDLSNNLIDGMLPKEIGGLRNLTLLDLRSNKISGGLVGSLQGMVSLEVMLLSNNPLGGSIMDVNWQNLRNLTTLGLSNTRLTGNIPESIANLMALRFLALDNNQLVGSVSPKLSALPSIGALYLNGNNLTGPLEFPGDFFDRMGRRFAAWGNPNLCYSVGLVSTGHVPVGVNQCKPEQEASSSNSDSNKVENGASDQSSSSPMASFGSSVSSTFWFLWAVFLMVLLI